MTLNYDAVLIAERGGVVGDEDGEGTYLDRIIGDVNYLKASGVTMGEFITGCPAVTNVDDTNG